MVKPKAPSVKEGFKGWVLPTPAEYSRVAGAHTIIAYIDRYGGRQQITN